MFGENDPTRPEHSSHKRGLLPFLVGFLVGAASGAILGFLVNYCFPDYIIYLWGAIWTLTELEFIAVVIGLVIGGVAGATCRPIVGAVTGGSLSACSCSVLFLQPAGAVLSFRHGSHSLAHSQSMGEVLTGFVFMTIAGALAGAIGALAGSRVRRPRQAKDPT